MARRETRLAIFLEEEAVSDGIFYLHIPSEISSLCAADRDGVF
jgi:hypothetical protein